MAKIVKHPRLKKSLEKVIYGLDGLAAVATYVRVLVFSRSRSSSLEAMKPQTRAVKAAAIHDPATIISAGPIIMVALTPFSISR